MQQELLSKLNKLERTKQNDYKNTEKKSTKDLIKIEKKNLCSSPSETF